MPCKGYRTWATQLLGGACLTQWLVFTWHLARVTVCLAHDCRVSRSGCSCVRQGFAVCFTVIAVCLANGCPVGYAVVAVCSMKVTVCPQGLLCVSQLLSCASHSGCRVRLTVFALFLIVVAVVSRSGCCCALHGLPCVLRWLQCVSQWLQCVN